MCSRVVLRVCSGATSDVSLHRAKPENKSESYITQIRVFSKAQKKNQEIIKAVGFEMHVRIYFPVLLNRHVKKHRLHRFTTNK